MSARKLMITIIILILSACSSIPLSSEPALSSESDSSTAAENGQRAADPSEIYLTFIEAIKGDDIQQSMDFFHEGATLTIDYYGEDRINLEHYVLSSPEQIKGEIQAWMNEPYLHQIHILKIINEGNRAYYWIEYHCPDGWSGAHSGFAEIKDGKIIRLHYDPLQVYHRVEQYE